MRRNFLVSIPSFASFEAMSVHLEQRCLERLEACLDLELYPYLPRSWVNTTSAGDYMTLLSGRAA